MSSPAITIQPFGYYLFLTGSDHMHYGYWPPGCEDISLSDAQDRHTRLLYDRIKGANLRILDVGCGLGASTHKLSLLGHEVVGIAPSSDLVRYASENNPGPEYIDCGFLSDNPIIVKENSFDLVLFQESLQYLPDLDAVFERIKHILKPGGRVIICDEVSRDSRTNTASDVHSAVDIESAFGKVGFFVRWHCDISNGVAETTTRLTRLFKDHRSELIDHFGDTTEPELSLYIEGWERTRKWYYEGAFGYEVWELQPSDYRVRRFREGDEQAILTAFESAFHGSRSIDHWNWKFKQNPFGGPFAVIVQDQDGQIASHFSAYPVPFFNGEAVQITQQVGDTFTLPSYRGEGRGRTSLLARAVRLFRRSYCEGKIDFYYGFNTGKIQEFGSRFLDYIPASPVYEHRIEAGLLKETLGRGLKYRLHGYRARVYGEAGSWADRILDRAKDHYSWFVNRSSEYLNWRYAQCPDKFFTFLVIYRWGQPVGWLLIWVDDGEIVVGDALFAENNEMAVAFAFYSLLRHVERTGEMRQEVSGWFSETPQWWCDFLHKTGFNRKRQPQDLDLCLSIFRDDLKSQDFVQNMYFTKGDSDLL